MKLEIDFKGRVSEAVHTRASSGSTVLAKEMETARCEFGSLKIEQLKDSGGALLQVPMIK